MPYRALPILLLLLACLIEPAGAADKLIVIFDNGQTRPLAPFLKPLRSAGRAQTSRPPDRRNLGAADLEQLLPIKSPGLTPGTIIRRKHKVPFARPFFMVGADSWSLRWLADHRAHLIAIGAVGLLVEAATVDDLKRMADIAGDLSLTPASGSDVARALGVRHYPVVLSGGYVWQ